MRTIPLHKAKELIEMFKSLINDNSFNEQEKAEQAALTYARGIKSNVNSKNVTEYAYWLDVIECIKNYE